MNQRSSASARVFAATALVVAFVLAVALIAGSIGGDSSDSTEHGRRGEATHRTAPENRKVPATYVIQSGDTLVAIARETGVPVAQIQALNPQVDPQILIAGEELKLK